MNDEQTDKVLELVVFALDEGVTRGQFMGTVEGVTGWIRSQPGFMSYDLSDSPGGTCGWWAGAGVAPAAAIRRRSSQWSQPARWSRCWPVSRPRWVSSTTVRLERDLLARGRA